MAALIERPHTISRRGRRGMLLKTYARRIEACRSYHEHAQYQLLKTMHTMAAVLFKYLVASRRISWRHQCHEDMQGSAE